MSRARLVSRQEDVPLPVLVTAYKDKSFEFVRCICRAAVLLSCLLTGLCGALFTTGCEESARHVFYQEGGGCVATGASPRHACLNVRGAGILSGSQKPGHTPRGSISLKHVYEIAKARLRVGVLRLARLRRAHTGQAI